MTAACLAKRERARVLTAGGVDDTCIMCRLGVLRRETWFVPTNAAMFKPRIRQLFKYRVFNDYSLQALRANEIWASDPAKFNDPFEYSYHIDPDLTFEAARTLNKKINTKQKHDRIQQEFIREGKKFVASCGGIYSLCENNKISLMWSHYGDSHKGFCIGYSRADNNILGTASCLPVSYGIFPAIRVTDILQAVLMKQQFEGSPHMTRFVHDNFFFPLLFKKMVLSKDANWSYEKEWRLMFVERDQLIRIDAPICSITFGMRMADEQKGQIRKILRKQSAIKFYQAYKPKRGYDVALRRLN